MRALTRRQFVAAGMAAAGSAALRPAPVRAASEDLLNSIRFRRVLDLTHTLTPDFPTGTGQPQLSLETVSARPRDRWNIRRWHIHEHTGTHLDAPWHCSDGDSADRIPASQLVGPLAVIDIRSRVANDPDAQLTLDDLKQWESRHGPLPAGVIVAMCSGWDAHVRTPKFRNVGPDRRLHTPGFHLEAIEFLLAERQVNGIVVDTLSLDPGLSRDFAVHVRWLGSNRWGLECAANLADAPAAGATLIVGAPKIAGASGGPSRVLALIP